MYPGVSQGNSLSLYTLNTFLIQFFVSGVHDPSLAVGFVVHVIGVLDVLFVLHQLACGAHQVSLILIGHGLVFACLLYTSDAADE